jgi:small subunit ribosomal protein S1
MSEENINNEEFATLLKENFAFTSRLQPGEKVKSRIVSISGDMVYIDLGGKSDGFIDLNEFKDEHGAINVNIGDNIEAFFSHMQDGMMRLTTLVNGHSIISLKKIIDAYEAATPVYGEVKKEIKGGFEVSLHGIRCFCPYSQINLKAARDASAYLGQTFLFRILEYKNEGRNIIVSRRVLLEEEKRAEIQNLKETLSEGMIINRKIKSIRNFGLFIDLNGIDGFIPIGELSWSRIDNIEEVFALGQAVTAKVLSLDWDNERIVLSIKATQPDPWLTISDKYPVGSKVNGVIVRFAPFGAFVNIEPGVDGLIHISNFGTGRRINHPKEVVEIGQPVEAYVVSSDAKDRKISLSLQPKSEPQKIILPAAGKIIEGIVERVMPYGIFLKLDENLTGLIPNAEMGTPQGSDHSRMFPAGSSMKAVVIEADELNNRVRLSRKEVLAKIEQEEFYQYLDSTKKEEVSTGMGRLGELLKTKMAEKNIKL